MALNLTKMSQVETKMLANNHVQSAMGQMGITTAANSNLPAAPFRSFFSRLIFGVDLVNDKWRVNKLDITLISPSST